MKLKTVLKGAVWMGAIGIHLAAIAPPSFAQDAMTAVALDEDEEERRLDIVVVSATKRDESVQDVSLSMNVFGSEALEDENISDFMELSAQIPGVTFFQTPTIPALSMRGVATGANNPAADQTVALYTDGIFAGRARQFQAPFFDVERIEVLRGPQGALLGKNTAAGALSIVSANPTDELVAEGRATYLFDRQGVDASGFVSGPIASTLNGRIAVKYLKTTEGWLDNAAVGEGDPQSDVLQGRVGLEWSPFEGFTSLLKAETTSFDETGRPSGRFDATVPLKDVISFDRDAPGVFGIRDGTKVSNTQVSNTATWDIGDMQLVSVTGYAEFDADSVGGGGANNPEVFGTTLLEEFQQISQEVRLLSPSDQPFEWIVGAYVDQSKYAAENIPRYFLFGGVIDGQGHTYFDQDSDTVSVYATGSLQFTQNLRGVLGGRYTKTNKKGTFDLEQDFGLPLGYSVPLNLSGKIADSSFDPSVTLEYDLGDNVMVYAGYSQGSKGGAFQGASRTATAETFELLPEESENYEIGFKSSFGDYLILNMSVFEMTIDNLQSGQYIGDPPTLVNVNVGKTQSRGLEWVLSAAVLENLQVDFSGTYLDAKYADYPGAPCTFAQLQDGCVNGSINAAGRGLSGQPKWSGSIGAVYSSPFAASTILTVAPRVSFRTKRNIDANIRNPNYGFQDGYAKVDLRIAVEPEDGTWEVALVGKNIFDEITANAAFGWGPPFAATAGATTWVEPGRSIGLQFAIRN